MREPANIFPKSLVKDFFLFFFSVSFSTHDSLTRLSSLSYKVSNIKSRLYLILWVFRYSSESGKRSYTRSIVRDFYSPVPTIAEKFPGNNKVNLHLQLETLCARITWIASVYSVSRSGAFCRFAALTVSFIIVPVCRTNAEWRKLRGGSVMY